MAGGCPLVLARRLREQGTDEARIAAEVAEFRAAMDADLPERGGEPWRAAAEPGA